jgi:hypothetical protein
MKHRGKLTMKVLSTAKVLLIIVVVLALVGCTGSNQQSSDETPEAEVATQAPKYDLRAYYNLFSSEVKRDISEAMNEKQFTSPGGKLLTFYDEWIVSHRYLHFLDGSTECDFIPITITPDDSAMSILVRTYREKELCTFNLIVNDLGLTQSLLTEMSNTRAIDGKQTAEFDGLKVSWTYDGSEFKVDFILQ